MAAAAVTAASPNPWNGAYGHMSRHLLSLKINLGGNRGLPATVHSATDYIQHQAYQRGMYLGSWRSHSSAIEQRLRRRDAVTISFTWRVSKTADPEAHRAIFGAEGDFLYPQTPGHESQSW